MNRSICLGVALVCVMISVGACAAAENYEMLFKDTTSKLSKKEKQQIFMKLGFQLSENKEFIVDDTCGNVYPSVEVVDLNGDGVEEVFVAWGNTCTFGMTGQAISLFVKDHSGQFVDNFGFPGIHLKLATRNKGFPDLLIGGPGFCHSFWQWTGTKYEYKCNREEQPGGCAWKDIDTVCK